MREQLSLVSCSIAALEFTGSAATITLRQNRKAKIIVRLPISPVPGVVRLRKLRLRTLYGGPEQIELPVCCMLPPVG